MTIRVPPLPEQRAMVGMILCETVHLTAAVDRAGREILLLRECRTRLIADVVTGKFDVREAAARLPDEMEEPEPHEEAVAVSDGEENAADDLDDAAPDVAEA